MCNGYDIPLAQPGMWHLPGEHTIFFTCADDVCNAETAAAAANESSNCVFGRTGNVCGDCLEGWAEDGTTCVPCKASDPYTAWGAASKAGALIGAVLLLLLASGLFLLSELRLPDPSRKRKQAEDATLVSVILTALTESATIVLDALQIVSSFQRTMHIKWPTLYRQIMGKLLIVNLSFLHFPKTACATQRSTFYNELNGVTIGVAGALCWILVLWMLGRAYARIVSLPEAVLVRFNSHTLARTCLLLNSVYAPVSEAVLATFACRPLGDALWLYRSTSTECGTPLHSRYRKLAYFWSVVYVFGIPATFVVLLVYYRIPHSAERLRRTALLRSVVDFGFRRGIEQPEGVNTSTVTEENMTDAHLQALVVGLGLERKRRTSLWMKWRLLAERGRRNLSMTRAAALDAAESAASDVDSLHNSLDRAERLNLLQLAPGGHMGRFCIWTKSAFEKLDSVFGTVTTPSSQKKGFKIPRSLMANADLNRVINSDEIQSLVNAPKDHHVRASLKKNPLRNLGAMLKLNPYAKVRCVCVWGGALRARACLGLSWMFNSFPIGMILSAQAGRDEAKHSSLYAETRAPLAAFLSFPLTSLFLTLLLPLSRPSAACRSWPTPSGRRPRRRARRSAGRRPAPRSRWCPPAPFPPPSSRKAPPARRSAIPRRCRCCPTRSPSPRAHSSTPSPPTTRPG
jgi:hypothetical protein